MLLVLALAYIRVQSILHPDAAHDEVCSGVVQLERMPGLSYGAAPLTSRLPEYERTPLLHYPGARDLSERGFVYAK